MNLFMFFACTYIKPVSDSDCESIHHLYLISNENYFDFKYSYLQRMHRNGIHLSVKWSDLSFVLNFLQWKVSKSGSHSKCLVIHLEISLCNKLLSKNEKRNQYFWYNYILWKMQPSGEISATLQWYWVVRLSSKLERIFLMSFNF